jgi:hypothetical protein
VFANRLFVGGQSTAKFGPMRGDSSPDLQKNAG